MFPRHSEAAPPVRAGRIDWRFVWRVLAPVLVTMLVAGVVWLNLTQLEIIWRFITVRHLTPNDWQMLSTVAASDPYANPNFHWSVPAAWVWATAVAPLGFLAWSALHFAALATIRDWRVVALALLTFPFWWDLVSGNMMVFAFVAAWHALSGSRWGVVAFCILAAFVPRPIMLPVLAWLLWHRTDARWAFMGAAGLVIATGLLTGTLGTWAQLLLAASGPEYAAPWNLGPSRWIGAAWVPAGLLLAAWATWRGHLGLASLAVSPYLIHYYAIFALLELRQTVEMRMKPGMSAAAPPAPAPMLPVPASTAARME